MSSSRDLDKFYTKSTTVEQCIQYITNHINKQIDTIFDCIIEPSAGSGVWSKHFPECIAIDIKPEHPSIQQGNFLEMDLNSVIHDKRNIIVIGNPPFGKQCSLAIKFFNKGASYSKVNCIAMIFPNSFKKISIQKRLNLYFHLEFQYDITDAFTLDGEDYMVPCTFQIWIRKDYPRIIPEMPVLVNPVFSFLAKKNIKDGMNNIVAIRRVGFYAGKCYPYNNQNSQTHYFVKILNTVDSDVITYLNNIEWNHGDTTGPRSISKRQLIPILNNYK
jgi:hypothetical protein